VFLYSALLAVPNELVEAANIDGAGGWTTFWEDQVSLIAPQFGLIAILTYIWTFNGFDLVFALNGSAPGPNYSTDILGTYFYRTFFGSSGQLAISIWAARSQRSSSLRCCWSPQPISG